MGQIHSGVDDEVAHISCDAIFFEMLYSHNKDLTKSQLFSYFIV
jgi:hypothetical protein